MGEAARKDSPADRGRVQQSIGWAVERWCREREASGQKRFCGAELEAAVCDMTGCVPGSPLRIFRAAVRNGLIRARLLDRGASLYELGAPPSPRPQEARPATSSLPPRGVVGRASVSDSPRPSPNPPPVEGSTTGRPAPAGRKPASFRECPCGCHLDPGPIVRCFYGGGR